MNKKNIQSPIRHGFTLIELLVVIAIIATIISFALPNFLSARQRARDAKRKSDLIQMKNALRLYYNDYQIYPVTDLGSYLKACGTTGAVRCPVCTTAEFAAGPLDGCQTVYMRQFPKGVGGQEWKYFGCPGGDDFRLYIDTMENISDPDIAASQLRCPSACGSNYGAGTKVFAVCAD